MQNEINFEINSQLERNNEIQNEINLGEIQNEMNIEITEIDYEAETEPMEEEEHEPEPMEEIRHFPNGQLEAIRDGWVRDSQEEQWLQDPQREIDDG